MAYVGKVAIALIDDSKCMGVHVEIFQMNYVLKKSIVKKVGEFRFIDILALLRV